MANTNIKKEAFKLKQTGEQIQAILDVLQVLGTTGIKDLTLLLQEIKDLDADGDGEKEGLVRELLDALGLKLNISDIQSAVNDETKKPPSSKAVKTAIASETTARNKAIQGLQNTINQDIQGLRIADINIRSDIADMNNIIDKLSAPPIKLSERMATSSPYRCDLDDVEFCKWFVLYNDTFDEVDYLVQADEYGYKLSETIHPGETRACIITEGCSGGADPENGYIFIAPSKMPKGGGTWHRGTSLTHTAHTKETLDIGAKAGDFYLNTEHYYIYVTFNGNEWTYIGNLNGSIDTTNLQLKGEPTAPTPNISDESTRIATTKFVREAIDRYSAGSTSGGSGSNSIATFFASELCNQSITGYVETPKVDRGQLFMFVNDTEDDLNEFYVHDEYGNIFSEPVKQGTTRICVITDFAHRPNISGESGVDGYVYVFPTNGYDRATKLEIQYKALESRIKKLEEVRA